MLAWQRPSPASTLSQPRQSPAVTTPPAPSRPSLTYFSGSQCLPLRHEQIQQSSPSTLPNTSAPTTSASLLQNGSRLLQSHLHKLLVVKYPDLDCSKNSFFPNCELLVYLYFLLLTMPFCAYATQNPLQHSIKEMTFLRCSTNLMYQQSIYQSSEIEKICIQELMMWNMLPHEVEIGTWSDARVTRVLGDWMKGLGKGHGTDVDEAHSVHFLGDVVYYFKL